LQSAFFCFVLYRTRLPLLTPRLPALTLDYFGKSSVFLYLQSINLFAVIFFQQLSCFLSLTPRTFLWRRNYVSNTQRSKFWR